MNFKAADQVAALRERAQNGPDMEASVDAVIAGCDDDPRAAIQSLIIANSFLEAELDKALAAISRGYVRGRYDI